MVSRREAAPESYAPTRQIEIQTFSTTRDRFGGTREAWTPLAGGPLWADAREGRNPREVYIQDADRAVAFRYLTFRIRWRSDFNETARVMFDGTIFDIKGLAEIGRRQFLDIITASAP